MDSLLLDASSAGLDEHLQDEVTAAADRLPTVTVLASSLALAACGGGDTSSGGGKPTPPPVNVTPLTEAHETLHHAIVVAAASPRIEAAHRALGGELRLFLTQLRPVYDGPTLAAEHRALLDELEHGAGPEALRPHIQASTAALLERLR